MPGWTKSLIIEQAYEQLGIVNPQPKQVERAERQLDAMMASWDGQGVHVGWPSPTTPSGGELHADLTHVSINVIAAIYLNLALLLAPTIGKTVSPQTLVAAAKAEVSMQTLFGIRPPERQFPADMPMGAGNERYGIDRVFFPEPTPPVLSDVDDDDAG